MALPLNVKRIWVSTVLLAMLVSLTACGGVDARKAKYFAKGQKYYSSENYEKARLEYSNVLKIDPKHVQANYELARTFEKLNKVREAGGFYLKVIDLDPKNYPAMVRLGRIYLLANATNEAKSNCDQALAIAPNDASAIALRGGIHARLGEIDAAVVDAAKALSLEPNNLDALALMAGIHLHNNNHSEAAKVIEAGVQQNPNNSELRQLLSGIYLKQGERAKAITVLQELVTLEPEKLPYRIQLAEFYLANNAAEEAEKVALESVAKFTDDTTAMRYHVDLVRRRGDIKRAEDLLVKYIADNRKEYDLQFMLSALYAGSKRTPEAVAVLEKIIKNDGKEKNGLMARDELAKYYLSTNDSAKAEQLFEEVLKESPQDNDALILRGNLALAKKDYTRAIGDLRAALRNQPNQASLLRQLAKAHEGNGEKELAKQTYQTALTAEPLDVTLYLEYTAFLMNSGETDQAIKTLDTAATIAPADRRILEAKFNIYLSKKDAKATLQVAEKILTTAPEKGKGAGYYAVGLAYQLQGNHSSAKTNFAKALDLEPDSPQLLTAYVRNLIAMKQTDAAIKFLKDRARQNQKNAIAHNLLGEIYLSQKKFPEALSAFELAQQAQPDWAIPYRNQALAYLQGNKLEEGIKAYQHGYEQTKGDPSLGYALASLYSQINRSDDAIKQLESLLQKSPGSEIARNNLAMMLVTHRADKASIDKAVQLIEPLKQSVNPNYLDTIGWVLYKNGEVKESIPYLRKARDKASDATVINYHLGMALFKSGDKPAAKPLLEAVVNSPQPFTGMDEAKEALRQL
jgi:tetratricopeptide (TPR) repeat protein